ncbi:MAG TPA: hypothetical protein ENI69_00395 [Rhodospirillales bacterium]|nr:hypothetical protein [Rhodospirillales bacterium]
MQDQENVEDQDFAQVTVQTPFSGDALAAFLQDAERLLRINSQMEYEHWRQTGDGEHEFKALNLSIDKPIETTLRSQITDDGLVIRYGSGLKTSTTFRISATPEGPAELIVIDDYSGTSADQRRARMDEVDKSLVQWGRDIHRYLHLWKKWSWVPGWKWYMLRVWHGMKPSARRISSMIMMIGLAEFIMFAMVFVVFWLELDNFLN